MPPFLLDPLPNSWTPSVLGVTPIGSENSLQPVWHTPGLSPAVLSGDVILPQVPDLTLHLLHILALPLLQIVLSNVPQVLNWVCIWRVPRSLVGLNSLLPEPGYVLFCLVTGCSVLEEVMVPTDVVSPHHVHFQGLQVPSGVHCGAWLQEIQAPLPAAPSNMILMELLMFDQR